MRVYRHMMAKVGAVLLLTCAFAVSTAEAAFKLRLTNVEAAISVTITDQGLVPPDLSPIPGVVVFSGPVGDYLVNVTTGTSKPLLPNTSSIASMDLNSINVSTTADVTNTLKIELTDTDFVPQGHGTLLGNVGGTTDGTVSFDAYKNDSNVEFDIVAPEADVHLGPFGTGAGTVAFAGTATDAHGPIGTFSMTMVATIVHGAGVKSTSFDFDIDNIPEPTSLALFGIGLIGAGVAARRARKQR